MTAHKPKSRISASVFESAKALHDSQVIDDDKIDEFKELCLEPAGIPENFLSGFIQHCEKTGENEWCRNIVRSKGGDKNCLFGHLCNYAGDDLRLGELYWDHFEHYYASTYMVYPVNDGENPKYKQPTPKQRCIAYLQDLIDGKTPTSIECMEEDYNRWLERQND